MSKHTAAQIRSKTEMVKKVVKHHFGGSIRKIEFKPAGKTNYVFEVISSKGDFIVRISDIRSKLNDFIKEQWAARKVAEKGVPVPEILEVGDEIISLPYMMLKKVEGKEAMDHPERLNILFDLGCYAKKIHSVSTEGFGQTFNLSKNKFSKKQTWSDFIEKELRLNERIKFLEQKRILEKKKITRLIFFFEKIKRWKLKPSLNHCDLRLKNVLANDAGKIQAIIDWENCSSNMAPYWDFSIALHDLSIDGKQKFLEGYGLDFEEFTEMSYALTAFNLINYIPTLQKIIENKDKVMLDLYKLRLNGSLDLFSL
jgi:aminoglycoside phosphotransferase (APT) family kinase protein